ncbi:PhzF family phenazine biosynthesis protein [Desulfobacterota bacterium AH_259_B03_O07]|nr:PhzF family phenazine biosynthesis protein [Desulfobacterota bacterium AH_259_B03_O07]
MGIPFFHVNAFTDKHFSGNPAGVCILEGPMEDSWMQNVARELNFADTAFLNKKGEGFNLRWFTPEVEIDLCGHATLASAHILWEKGYLKRGERALFYTRSGLLTADLKDNWIEMDFPEESAKQVSPPSFVTKAIGVIPRYVGKNRFDYLVEVNSEKDLRQLRPDLSLIKKIPVRGVIVTSVADSKEYDFVSRFFAPAVGIDEDHVTGSAHCCLGPYWRYRLDKDEFSAYQASPRGGKIRIRLSGDRVLLIGQAVTFLCGELTI